MSRLPPGPASTLIATIRYLRDPYQSMLADERRYGSPYTSPGFLGKTVVTGDPAGIRTVFTADPDTYAAYAADILRPVLGGESILVPVSDERHRAIRKLQTPSSHGARMQVYDRLFIDITAEHASRWPRQQPVSIHESMQDLSLDITLQALFGFRKLEVRNAFKEAVVVASAALKPSFIIIPALRREFFGLSAWSRYQRARKRLSELFDMELAERRADSSPRVDILSLLLSAREQDSTRMTDEQLLTQMLTLVGAGYETTATGLTWALFFILRDPGVKERLATELRSLPASADPEAITQLPYLQAVCNEAMRLRPVAPLIRRTLRKSLTLQGYELPPGITVGIGILLVHRRADLFPQPERFLPERFLDRDYTPFEFLPFGGGSQRCPGAVFGLHELMLVLATILGKHSLRLIKDVAVRSVVRNLTVGPAPGMEMLRL